MTKNFTPVSLNEKRMWSPMIIMNVTLMIAVAWLFIWTFKINEKNHNDKTKQSARHLLYISLFPGVLILIDFFL